MRAALRSPAALKTERRRALLDIIDSRPVRTQEELAEELRRRGFDVTQATVSRDIRDLGLLRVSRGNGLHYVADSTDSRPVAPAARLAGALRDHLLGLEFVGSIGVLHTRPSTAPLVASAIDCAHLSGVVGTVAGDDTVLVIVRTAAAGSRLSDSFRDLAGDTP